MGMKVIRLTEMLIVCLSVMQEVSNTPDPQHQDKWLPQLSKCCAHHQFYEVASAQCLDISQYTGHDPDELQLRLPVPNDDYDDYNGDYDVDHSQDFNVTGWNGLPRCDDSHELSVVFRQIGQPLDHSMIIDKPKQRVLFTLQQDSFVHQQFCIDHAFRIYPGTDVPFQHLGTLVAFCLPLEEDFCQNNVCLQSCCPFPMVFDLEHGVCQYPDPDLGEPIWRPEILTDEPLKRPRLFYDRAIRCPFYRRNFSQLSLNQDYSFRLTDEHAAAYKYNQFCVDYLEDDGFGRQWTQARVCVVTSDRDQTFMDVYVIPGLCGISVLCHLILIVFSLKLNLRYCQRMLLLTLTAASISLYSVIGVLKSIGVQMFDQAKDACVASGFIIQCSQLVSMLAVNALTFDSLTNRPHPRPQKARLLLLHGLYCVGLPFTITTITVLLNSVEGESHLLLPDIGSRSCFFSKPMVRFLYLHMFATASVCANLLGLWYHRQRLAWHLLGVRLFLVVASCWSLQSISWLLGLFLHRDSLIVAAAISLCDVASSLQGLALLLAFCFQSHHL